MKVNFSYRKPIVSQFMIADIIGFLLGYSKDQVFDLGHTIYHSKFGRFLDRFSFKPKREIEVTFSDVVDLDHTLATIIYHSLVKYRDEAVEIVCISCDEEDYRGDNPNAELDERGLWMINELIWTFENIMRPKSFLELVPGTTEKTKVPFNQKYKRIPGEEEYQKRIENGLKLFGKYFRNLWI